MSAKACEKRRTFVDAHKILPGWIYLVMPYIWIYSRKTNSDQINCSDQVLRQKFLQRSMLKIFLALYLCFNKSDYTGVANSQCFAPCSSIQMLGQFCFAQSGQQKAFRLGQEITHHNGHWMIISNFLPTNWWRFEHFDIKTQTIDQPSTAWCFAQSRHHLHRLVRLNAMVIAVFKWMLILSLMSLKQTCVV